MLTSLNNMINKKMSFCDGVDLRKAVSKKLENEWMNKLGKN